MARHLCENCERPVSACICSFISKTDNKTPVLILQHPSEIKQSKGTVALLKRSLNNCHVLIGEDFSNNAELNTIIDKHNALLLYPSDNAQTLNCSFENTQKTDAEAKINKQPLLIILDGTWKKAYRMFMLSTNLHCLQHVCLPSEIANNGQYLIRKVAKKNALSSLEATCYALAILENELTVSANINERENDEMNAIYSGRYQLILDKFSQFNQFQLSFRK